MKVTFPVRIAKPADTGERALTLLEMMVAVALLMMIVVGLTTMFLQTQKAFKAGLKQVDIFESERLVMDMLTRDFEQMADAGKGTNCYSFYSAHFPAQEWVQSNETQIVRNSFVQNVFALTRVNDQWIGIGYAVSNALVAGNSTLPGVGTLYRYSTSLPFSTANNRILANNYLFAEFTNSILHNQNPYTNFHRVADGVIHFSARTLDTNGNYVINGNPRNSFPCTNITYINGIRSTNYLPLPGFIEIELGMVEPETYEQARSMGNDAAALNFLGKRASKVHVFRQQIPIRAASR